MKRLNCNGEEKMIKEVNPAARTARSGEIVSDLLRKANRVSFSRVGFPQSDLLRPSEPRRKEGRGLQITPGILDGAPRSRPVTVGQYEGELLIKESRQRKAQRALLNRMQQHPFELTEDD